MDLLAAHARLVDHGFEVRFSNDISRTFRRYAIEGGPTMVPAVWLEDVDPEPGASARSIVTITALECPNRAPSCD